ncbi:MAG: cupin domain-containing protein [Pseudonocardiales bacterium]|nr:cupin domain-containing protein [Pseudonocardiales bacterium]
MKIDAGHTDGHYQLFEVDAPRGPATPLHRTGWGKAYYVLHGRMIVEVEAEGFDLGPGSSITIPPGAPHTFTGAQPDDEVSGDEPDRRHGQIPRRPRRYGAPRPSDRGSCAGDPASPGSPRRAAPTNAVNLSRSIATHGWYSPNAATSRSRLENAMPTRSSRSVPRSSTPMSLP